MGNDIYNANKLEWTDGAFSNLNMLGIINQRFTNINDQGIRITDPTELAKLNANATIWSPVRVQRWWLHSWAIEDGSYLGWMIERLPVTPFLKMYWKKRRSVISGFTQP